MAKIKNLQFRAQANITEYPEAASIAYAAGAGALPLTHPVIRYTSAGTEAITIAAGEPGQLLYIDAVAVSSGDGTLNAYTGVNSVGWTDLIFNTAGDKVLLNYIDDTVGWIILSAIGVAGTGPAYTAA